MNLRGETSRTIVSLRGLFSVRVEAFEDDRFRLMFVLSDNLGRDIRWLPVKFRKGTKSVNLDEVWPSIEKAIGLTTP